MRVRWCGPPRGGGGGGASLGDRPPGGGGGPSSLGWGTTRWGGGDKGSTGEVVPCKILKGNQDGTMSVEYPPIWNCSSEAKGSSAHNPVEPVACPRDRVFYCALTLIMPSGLATSASTAPKDWSWEKLIAESSDLVDAAWAHLVAHPTLAAKIPVEHRSTALLSWPGRPQQGSILPLCPASFSNSLGLPW